MTEKFFTVSPRTGRLSREAVEGLGRALQDIPRKFPRSRGALVVDVGQYIDEVSNAFFEQAGNRNRVSPRLSLNLEPTQFFREGLAATDAWTGAPVYLVRLPDAVRARALALCESQGRAYVVDSLSRFLLPEDVLLIPRPRLKNEGSGEWLMMHAIASDVPRPSTHKSSILRAPDLAGTSFDEFESDKITIVKIELVTQAAASYEEHVSLFRGESPESGLRMRAETTADLESQVSVSTGMRNACQLILDRLESDTSVARPTRLEFFYAGSGVVSEPSSEPLVAGAARGFLIPPRLSYCGSILEPVIFSHACASVVFALNRAQERIQDGATDAVLIAGGLHLSSDTIHSMSSLGTLSREQAKPFDEARDGTQISGGFGALLVMSSGAAQRSGRNQLATVQALRVDIEDFGAATDSNQVLEHLAKTLNAETEDPDVVVAHATGTVQGDLSEALALATVLRPGTPVVASKGATGHLLHAAGFTGIVHALALLGESTVYGTPGLRNPLPQPLCLPIEGQSESLPKPVQRVLVNSVGFGGNLGSFILSHPDSLK